MAKSISKASVEIVADSSGLKAGINGAMNMIATTMRGSRHVILSAFTGIVSGITTGLTLGVMRVTTTAVRGITNEIKKTISEGMNFETAMRKVSVQLDEQSQEVLPEYAKKVRELAKEYGVSKDIIAASLAEIIDRGTKSTKVMELLSGATKASVAVDADMIDVVRAATVAMQAFGDKAGSISDIIAKITMVGNDKDDIKMVAAGIEEIGFSAAKAGIKMEELLAFFEMMKKYGFSAEQSTQVLKPMMMERRFRGKSLTESMAYMGRISPSRQQDLGLNLRNQNAFNAAMRDTVGLQEEMNRITNDYTSILDSRLGRSLDSVAGKVDVWKQKFTDIRLEFIDWVKNNTTLFDTVNTALEKTKTYLDGILNTIKGEGFGAAFAQIQEDLKKAFTIAFDFIAPYAIDIGTKIGDAFLTAVKNGVSNIGGAFMEARRNKYESGQGMGGFIQKMMQPVYYGAIGWDYDTAMMKGKGGRYEGHSR